MEQGTWAYPSYVSHPLLQAPRPPLPHPSPLLPIVPASSQCPAADAAVLVNLLLDEVVGLIVAGDQGIRSARVDRRRRPLQLRLVHPGPSTSRWSAGARSSPTAVVTSASNCSSAPHPRLSTSPPTQSPLHQHHHQPDPSSPGRFSFIPPLLPHSSPRLARQHQAHRITNLAPQPAPCRPSSPLQRQYPSHRSDFSVT